MRTSLTIAGLALGLLLIGPACSRSPVERVADHMDEMVSLLEDNRDNPAEAGQRLQAYVQQHQADLEALAREVDGQKAYFNENPEKMADALQQLAPAIERLMQLQSERPALLANPDVAAALDRLRMTQPPAGAAPSAIKGK